MSWKDRLQSCQNCGKKLTRMAAKKCSIHSKKNGNEHHRWKGDSAGYGKLHEWIRKNWEKPKECQKCGLEKKLDWANISGKYCRSDKSDWLAICRACHVEMDMTDERRENCSKAAKERCQSPLEKIRLAKISKDGWTKEKKKKHKNFIKNFLRNAKGQFYPLSVRLKVDEAKAENKKATK